MISSRLGDEDDDDEARTAWFKLPFDLRLMEWRRRLERLHARLADQCPGEHHEYVEHGDGKPPYCSVCGFTDVGLHKSEVGMSHTGGHDKEDDEDYLSVLIERIKRGPAEQ